MFTFDQPSVESLCRAIGSANWVIARRTPDILARYGDDVVCLSREKYAEAQRIARISEMQGYD